MRSRNWQLRTRARGAGDSTLKGTEAHALAGIPILVEPGRQRVADDGGDARWSDERAGARGPVRRRNAEALVGEQHDADLRRVLPHVDRLVPVGIQDGLRPFDRAQWLGRVRSARLPGYVLG